MLLKISHRTEYSYDLPVYYALQRLRLIPHSDATQRVVDWALDIEGAKLEASFSDQFDNATWLVSMQGESQKVTITATGSVETSDTAGVYGRHVGYAPLWLFQNPTPLTKAAEGIEALAQELPEGSDLDRLHALMGEIGGRVVYTVGATQPATTAEEALALGQGVCQDHAHIFIAAARLLGFPARYVGGYLAPEDGAEQVASHAWAEAHVQGLGWVGFDLTNGISPDERYVRLAVGRDYRDAMPTSGIRLGQAREELAIRIVVEQ